MDDEQKIVATLATVDERTRGIVSRLDRIENHMTERYVSQDEFKPIKTIVFGFVGLVLVAVVGGLIALVVKSPNANTKPSPNNKPASAVMRSF